MWQTGPHEKSQHPATNVIVFLPKSSVTPIWLYHRYCLSFREVEELLAERGITVTYEPVRQWCRKFGLAYARKLKKRQGRLVIRGILMKCLCLSKANSSIRDFAQKKSLAKYLTLNHSKESYLNEKT